jgi:hypothetical protein
VASMKMRVFWDILSLCSLVGVDQRFRGAYCIHHRVITLMIQAVCTSGTSVCSETTWHYIPEGFHLHISLICEIVGSHGSQYEDDSFLPT